MSNDSMLNLTESSINSHDSMRFANSSNESVFLSSKSIKIQHVIAKFGPTNERIQKKKSKKLENNNLNKLIPTKYTIISCDSILSPDESMDKSSPTKSHEDFEIPSSLVPIFQYKGFTLEQPIGHGTYGKVYCAIRHGSNDQTKGWQHQERYAIKVMDMNRLSFQYRNKFLHKELNALLSIKPHCHIVKFYDVFKSSCAIDDFQYDKLYVLKAKKNPNILLIFAFFQYQESTLLWNIVPKVICMNMSVNDVRLVNHTFVDGFINYFQQ